MLNRVYKTLLQVAKLTPMGAVANRTYRAWGELESPI